MPLYTVSVYRVSTYAVQAKDKESAIDKVIDGKVKEEDCETLNMKSERRIERKKCYS